MTNNSNSSNSISQCTERACSVSTHTQYWSLGSSPVEIKTSNMFIYTWCCFCPFCVDVHPIANKLCEEEWAANEKIALCMMIGCMHWLAAIRNRYRRNREREELRWEWITKKHGISRARTLGILWAKPLVLKNSENCTQTQMHKAKCTAQQGSLRMKRKRE